MDLVDWDELEFEAIAGDIADFGRRVGLPDIAAIPISALNGDNVVERSDAAPWYDGPPLLEYLEEVDVAADRQVFDSARLPVQWVVRPHDDAHHDYRGHAGQVAGGVLRAGDEVVVLPQGARTRIARIDTFDGPVEEAFPPMSVTVLLEDDLDVSRGDLLCAADAPAQVARDVRADLCWLDDAAGAAVGPLPDQAHDADHARRADPHRAPRRGREPAHRERPRDARAQRHRPRHPAHGRAAGRRPLRRQPRHRQLHPDRRGDQRHRGRRDGLRDDPATASAAPTWSGSAARPRARTAGRRSARPAPRLAHRPAVVGQVGDRRRARGAAGRRRARRVPDRRRQPAPRPVRRPRLRRRLARRELAPRRRGGAHAGRRRHRRHRGARLALRRAPRARPAPPRGGRAAVRGDLRRHAAGGLRAARPEGALPPRPRRDAART